MAWERVQTRRVQTSDTRRRRGSDNCRHPECPGLWPDPYLSNAMLSPATPESASVLAGRVPLLWDRPARDNLTTIPFPKTTIDRHSLGQLLMPLLDLWKNSPEQLNGRSRSSK